MLEALTSEVYYNVGVETLTLDAHVKVRASNVTDEGGGHLTSISRAALIFHAFCPERNFEVLLVL